MQLFYDPTGSNEPIADGAAASDADGTAFGSVVQGTANIPHTFRLSNNEGDTVHLTWPGNPSGYTVTGSKPDTLLDQETTDFVITFNCASNAVGEYAAQYDIEYALDGPTYVFDMNLTGAVTALPSPPRFRRVSGMTPGSSSSRFRREV